MVLNYYYINVLVLDCCMLILCFMLVRGQIKDKVC